MLKITKMVRTVVAPPNNGLIGRHIQNRYRLENLKQPGLRTNTKIIDKSSKTKRLNKFEKWLKIINYGYQK